ncbi:hypothetical protein [Streptacidiphilus sp. P02-A3a]|uniref:hypothetical protein n=1 Tax=Streptacidiphilus sp. P02-A3a TaxID=2704468 RepID=UPI0015FDF6B3|nr:hypothetical protein [Streptacidiphilus sp. P02-A3a]QMU69999.1 hypothetical protein GXP74_18985 [Streptacidiphilus sp. P02-A3a]
MTTVIRTQQDTKLSYALSTNPGPLTASPPVAPGTEDELAYADLDLVISNSGSEAVRVSRIAIVLPIGSLAQDLAVSGESIEAYVSPESAWTIVDVQSDVLLAVPMAETALFRAAGSAPSADGRVRFEVTPAGGGSSEVTVDGLYVHLSGIKVSDKTGIARIQIEEWAAYDGDDEVERTVRGLEVAKFPFRSGGSPDPGIGRALVALESAGGPPATKVAAATEVVLEWNHLRGDNHELYADGALIREPDVSGASRWQAPADFLKRDTSFALKTVTPTPDGGFVVRWDHVTVCVADQTLAELAVTGTLGVTGKSTLGALQAATAKVTGHTELATLTAADTEVAKLTASGDTELGKLTAAVTQVSTLTATGLIQADLGLTVKAGQDLKANTVSPATAGGVITLNAAVAIDGGISGTLKTNAIAALTTNGTLTVNSGTLLKVSAFTNLLGNSWQITGAFTAPTDGLVFGFGNKDSVTVSGGLGTPTAMSKDTKDSIIVPVRKGAAVSLNRYDKGGWYFLPFGTA